MGTTDTVLILQRLLAITDTGLSFAASDFDRERYADIRKSESVAQRDQLSGTG